MMKHILRTALMSLLLLGLTSAALAAATPTPPPVMIYDQPAQPPENIQRALDIAYDEWETLAGKTLPRCNKFTEWRGKGVSFGWCAGYVTWCMMEAGVPMYEIEHFLDETNDTKAGFYPVEGVMHVQEAGVGKLLRAYQRMNRTTMIPQPGYILVYGCSYNKTIHVGLVYEVESLGEGRYRITTLEGNMSNRVKMYIRDYDMNAAVNTNNRRSTNLTEIPESDRVRPESSYVDYSIPSAKPSSGASNKYSYYVHCFLMPWVPEGAAATPTPEPTAVPTATPTPTPTPEATPVPYEEDVTAETDVQEIATPAPETIETPDSAEVADTAETADATEAADASESAEVTETPVTPADPTWPCQGKDGTCPYITRREDDPFCRHCDRDDNGIEDAKE